MNLKEVKHIVYINTLIYISIFIFFIISLLFILFGPLNVGARTLQMQCSSGDYSNCFAAYSGTSTTSLNTTQSLTNYRSNANYNVLSITSVQLQPNKKYNFTLRVATSSQSFKLNNLYMRLKYENLNEGSIDYSGYVNTNTNINSVTAQGRIINISFSVATPNKFTNSTSAFFLNFIFNESGYTLYSFEIEDDTAAATGVISAAIDTMTGLLSACYKNLWYNGNITNSTSTSPLIYAIGPGSTQQMYYSISYNMTYTGAVNNRIPCNETGSICGFRFRFNDLMGNATQYIYLDCDGDITCTGSTCSCSGSRTFSLSSPSIGYRLYNDYSTTTGSVSVRLDNISLVQGRTPRPFSEPGKNICTESYLDEIKENIQANHNETHDDLNNIDGSIQSGFNQQHQDLQSINSGIDSANRYLQDDSNPQVDSQGINNTMNSVQTSNPLSYLLTLPTNLLSTILQGLSSNTCTDFIIGKFGTIGRHDLGNYTFKFPCIDLEDKLGRDLWGTIDIFVAIGIIVVTIVKLYNTISNYLTLGAEEEVKSHSHFLSPMDFLGNVLGGNWSGVVSTTKGEF